MIRKFKFLKKYIINWKIQNSDCWFLLKNKFRKNNFFFQYLYKPLIQKQEYKNKKKFKNKKLKNFFFLQLGNIVKRKKKKYLKEFHLKKILNKKLFFFFFSNITLFELKKICKNLKKKSFFKFYNFIDILETRLDSILYRSNFFLNLKFLRKFIFWNNVLINKQKVIRKWFYLLKIGDYISIKYNLKLYHNIKKEMLFRLKKRNLIYNSNFYLFINYKLLFIYLYNKPSITYFYKKLIYYPKNLNLIDILNLNF